MTKDEAIQTYRQVADEDIDMLADLYLDFNDFDQIEFLIFRDRLSAAVLIANSVKKSLNGLASKYDAMRVDGSYAVPGWETETSENFDEKVGIPGAADQISIGATILTAVAALESLLIDLTPDSEPRVRRLRKLIQAFLDRYEVPNSQAYTIAKMGQRVGRPRNTFAHSLTGSYWETDESIAAMFTTEAMEDSLYTVGTIAILIEEIVTARTTKEETSE